MKKEYVYVLKEEYTETNNENIRLTAENIELNLELQRKDKIIKDAKEVLLTTNNIEKALNVLDKIKELENDL